uniref:(northern house mosquito) hypothetical protein n=1 Tax=Culex pipiens TaxID=7175 RepID=A0A8D8C2T0_CULPI
MQRTVSQLADTLEQTILLVARHLQRFVDRRVDVPSRKMPVRATPPEGPRRYDLRRHEPSFDDVHHGAGPGWRFVKVHQPVRQRVVHLEAKVKTQTTERVLLGLEKGRSRTRAKRKGV